MRAALLAVRQTMALSAATKGALVDAVWKATVMKVQALQAAQARRHR